MNYSDISNIKYQEEFMIWQTNLIQNIIIAESIPPHKQQQFIIKWIGEHAKETRTIYHLYYKQTKGNI